MNQFDAWLQEPYQRACEWHDTKQKQIELTADAIADQIKTDDELAAQMCDEIFGWMVQANQIKLTRALVTKNKDEVFTLMAAALGKAIYEEADNEVDKMEWLK